MKRLAILFAVALVSAAVSYFLVGLRQGPATGLDSGSDLAWLRAEFGLNDDEFLAVRKLHDDYSGRCAQHCADIVAARAALAALAPEATVERAAAAQRVLDLEVVCNDATRAHLRRVAAVMPSAEGERYLRTIEPHLAQLPHDGRRGLGR